jgi:hypothetical protein
MECRPRVVGLGGVLREPVQHGAAEVGCMTEAYRAVLHNPVQGHKAITEGYRTAKALLMAGHRLVLTIKPETRSDAQNRRLWAMLGEVSKQVDWHGQKLDDTEWKHVFSAALARQKVVPGLDGGFVVLGQSTSKMTKAEMSDMQTLMEAFGAERGVVFSESDPQGGN